MGERQFTYEFFLTSRATPDYKFRVLFMQYGIMGYPVKIVLEEGIADEIDAEHGYIYSVQSQEEYEEVLVQHCGNNDEYSTRYFRHRRVVVSQRCTASPPSSALR